MRMAPPSGSEPQPDADRRTMGLLTVEVAGTRAALPLELVLEIHAAVAITPLPDAPEVVLGLVDRRGRTLPVMDLRRRLGLPPRPVRLDDRLVVLQLPEREVAVLVDAALDVVEVPTSAVDEAVVRGTRAVRSQGVAVLPDGLVVVLDVHAFLSSVETAALDEAVAALLAATA